MTLSECRTLLYLVLNKSCGNYLRVLSSSKFLSVFHTKITWIQMKKAVIESTHIPFLKSGPRSGLKLALKIEGMNNFLFHWSKSKTGLWRAHAKHFSKVNLFFYLKQQYQKKGSSSSYICIIRLIYERNSLKTQTSTCNTRDRHRNKVMQINRKQHHRKVHFGSLFNRTLVGFWLLHRKMHSK